MTLRRISDRAVMVDVAGYFVPTEASQVLVGMPGTEDLFVCVFSTEGLLATAMRDFGIGYEGVAFVNDVTVMLDDLRATNASGRRPYRIRLAVDLHKADDGRGRFREVLLDLGESLEEN